MKRKLYSTLLLGTAFSLATLTSFAATPNTNTQAQPKTNFQSPVGYWETIDDHTGKPHGIVKIYKQTKTINGKTETVLNGKIYAGFLYKKSAGNPPSHTFCTKCSGELKNAKVIGLPIINNLKHESDSSVWDGGTILDPDSGSVYKSKITLTDQGQKLDVRGYIGFSLFGRSQTWLRITPKQIHALQTQDAKKFRVHTHHKLIYFLKKPRASGLYKKLKPIQPHDLAIWNS
ncbi:DUF2147 domain-containing protein [Piscirickettsia litoralis]|uniref:DUF2147 domain-containing protein n=1 Tax=Piscirickettsia litoralis TaxID=1891921 RepID=A0ABX3A903_9GAMM|nr:DUF2147 domain-containing protein [Piscirickettsia litoralis]ODN43915.1 hypothetical protein BGC07_14760 [Piscirickettsia litoralis]